MTRTGTPAWRRAARRSGGWQRGAVVRLAACALLLAVTAGCRQDMHDQAKLEPLEESSFFADGRASRQPVAGTVARGQLRLDRDYYEGRDEAGELIATLPTPPEPEVAHVPGWWPADGGINREMLLRGRERYAIFCSPCHDMVGNGNGMIVRRGYKQPQSFHIERLQQAPIGYYYDVMTNGFGQMPSYAGQVPVADRWAIAAYVRVLQLSQGATAAELTPDDRRKVRQGVSLLPVADVGGHSGGHGGGHGEQAGDGHGEDAVGRQEAAQ